MTKIHIIQHGTDGFGHQLEGLITTMAFHNIRNYYFDGNIFINKEFKYEHISNQNEALIVTQYLKHAVTQFSLFFKQQPIQYTNILHAHEIYKIPDQNNTDTKTLYSLDNVFHYNSRYIPHITQNEIDSLYKNIEILKPFFRNNPYLMQAQQNLVPNNIVIHIRMGDALDGGRQPILILDQLLDKLLIQYPNHTIYVHSDGNPCEYIKKHPFILFDKSTPLIQVMSDFINAKVIVCGNSSLVRACAFIGNQQLKLIHDDIPPCQFIDKNCIRISNYLSS